MEKSVSHEHTPIDLSSFHQRSEEFLEKMDHLIGDIRRETKYPAVLSLLSDFADYAGPYFREEETCYNGVLNRCEFSDHRRRHFFFENYLREPILKDDEKNQCDTEDLCAFLVDWVKFHLQHVDEDILRR